MKNNYKSNLEKEMKKERIKRDEFKKCLAKASKLDIATYTQDYREIDGAKQFKRRLLGFCGKSTVKTLNELEEIMMKIGIVDSRSKAKEFIDILYLAPPTYTYDFLEPSYLRFHVNHEKEICEITKHQSKLNSIY